MTITDATFSEHLATAMGSRLQILIGGDRPDLVPVAAARVAELEQRWSRFRPDSDVSRMNRSPGRAVPVSADTITLVEAALAARADSRGRFDPMMLPAVMANGYDRPFLTLRLPNGVAPSLDRRLQFGGVQIDRMASTAQVDPGSGFDPGGIGKGLAADIVAEELIGLGATGVLVNLGGDLRCLGNGPAGGAWVIGVGDVEAGVPARVLEMSEGAVASSTPHRRRWKLLDGGDAHHLLDPATGRSAAAPRLVTVIAKRCADAEWLATSIAVDGLVDASRCGHAAVLITDTEGGVSTHGPVERFLR